MDTFRSMRYKNINSTYETPLRTSTDRSILSPIVGNQKILFYGVLLSVSEGFRIDRNVSLIFSQEYC